MLTYSAISRFRGAAVRGLLVNAKVRVSYRMDSDTLIEELGTSRQSTVCVGLFLPAMLLFNRIRPVMQKCTLLIAVCVR